ncbi:MAG: divalent-cation tolerance protein CutA [Pseudomonadota bacterium]
MKTVEATQARIIICTCPNAQVAEQLSKGLMAEHLAMYVNIVPNLQSHYRWQGKIEQAQEYLLLIKTVRAFSDVEVFLLANHPYGCPEILSLGIEQVNQGYMAWLSSGGNADAVSR